MFPELSETDVMSKIKLGGVPDYLIRICQKDIIEQPSIEGQIVGKEAVKLISRQSRTEKRNELGDLQVQLLDRLGMGSLDRLEGLRVCHQWLEPATKLGMSHLCLKSILQGLLIPGEDHMFQPVEDGKLPPDNIVVSRSL
nr:uncharacterized protein LOC109159946 [Ipomoea batatas]